MDQGNSQSLTTDEAASRIEAQLFGKPEKEEESQPVEEPEEAEETEIEERA